MRGCGRMKDKPKYVCGSLTKDEIIHILNERNKLLVKALDKAIKKITLDNDSGMEFLDAQYEYWKEWAMEEVLEDAKNNL